MAKVKNKRNSGLADKVNNKRKVDATKKKLNPFEVHINREKIKVLGKKSKHEKGLPGVSRSKAMQKRKETLGVEMKLMNKSNAFIDKRIGEKNNQLSAEDRMIARFAAERAKQHTKKNIYNLADDEILTHRGQTLEQIEKFDDPRSDDEDEEGKGFGGLTDDFVSEGHFGGGMLTKSDAKDGAKSHKDLIEQLIAESKKRKAEKQKEKEQTLDLTEKLDSEWKDLQPVVFKRAKVDEESIIDKVLSQAEKKSADYDKMMRELRFEKRGTPSDGLKNNEKAAKEEREKLEQWEKERRERMLIEQPMGKPQQNNKKHRSVEDLDDNFELDDEKEFMLAYDNDGKPLVPENILKDFSVPNAKKKFDDGISDTSDEDEQNSGDESDKDDSNKSDESEESSDESESEQTKANGDVKKKGESILFQNSNSDSESDEESDNGEQLKQKIPEDKSITDKVKDKTQKSESTDSEESSDSEKEVQENKNQKLGKEINHSQTNKKKDVTKKSETESSEDDENSDSDNEIQENQKEAQNEIKPSNKKLLSNSKQNDEQDETGDESVETESESKSKPVNKVPKKDDFNDLMESDSESEIEMDDEVEIKSFFDKKTLEGNKLKELLTDKSPAEQTVALQKLIQSYDPSRSENNKELLSRLFAHMLQYTNDIFTNITDEGTLIKAFLTFDRLVPYFYDLAKTNKVSTKKFLIELLVEKRDIYKRNMKKIPDLDTLIFFKLISLLYPTSDFRHPITTPCLIFMAEILTHSRFHDTFSISRGLFITSLILEFTNLSKRLVPAAINFLRGILYLTAQTSILNPIQLVPPFKANKDARILNLERDCSKMDVVKKMSAKDLVLPVLSDDFKIRTFLTCTVMTKEFFENFHDMECQECLFEPHLKLLSKVDLDYYPKKVRSIVSEILKEMKNSLEMKTYTPLSKERARPKLLRLYEPDVQEVFTGSKSSKLSREMGERQRLQSKYKKEMKGALREIRRDKSYIASVKIKQKIHSDNIRKEKVKQIYKDASIQQGEINKLNRMK